MRTSQIVFALFFGLSTLARAAEPKTDTVRGDRMIAEYFRVETARLRDACLADVNSLEDWQQRRETYRQQLLEMLGLDPLPERTDLKATVTGRVEHDEFTVENLHFQSQPGLYVTANLYIPKQRNDPLPGILYVCGHGGVKRDGISYGNKVHYQHHGAWFARNGYVCLIIDSLQLGEIEGIHHGTYRHNLWWWLNRGYTPAGVEAWNCVRALDYLQSRREVDPQRLGVTGRSGGGAYSWWIAAIDDRIKAAVPVAGITDLQNHVVDGCVEGHCDCMFMVNTYRWDYPLVAALVAPRPLLISNTDRDNIFPLDGVIRTHEKVRRIYEMYGAGEKLGLNITAGTHKDTQELQVHAIRWLNHYLKPGDDSLIENPAVPFFEPEQLRVFQTLPASETNTSIQETFVATAAPAELPVDSEQWESIREHWRSVLLEKSFRGWPSHNEPLNAEEAFSVHRDGIVLRAIDFASQGPIRLRIYVAQPADHEKPDLVVLNVLDEQEWSQFVATMRPSFEAEFDGEKLPAGDEAAFQQLQQMFLSFNWAMAYVAPRGVGPTAWDASEKKQIHHRRRFYLLGQTLDAMQAWDVRRAIQTLRGSEDLSDVPLWLQSQRQMAGVALFGSLFESNITRLDLYQLPHTHRDGPFVLNIARYFDMPQAVAMAAERSQVVIYDQEPEAWKYPADLAANLGWPKKHLRIRKPAAGGTN